MAFPPHHIHPPQATHTHTIVLLHGRGSNGPEFAEEIFSAKTSDDHALLSQLPGWRWVFPSTRERWDTRFEEILPAWFDVYSLTNTDERKELQVEGLKESVGYILDIVEKEIALLDGKSEKVFLGGMSQGMATALWTLLCSPIRIGGARLGGAVVFSGWLPFAKHIEGIIQEACSPPTVDRCTRAGRFLLDTIGYTGVEGGFDSVLATPVFLSHGTDDAWVDVVLGRQAYELMRTMGIQAEWREYLGADNDGHWIKEPEGFDHLVQFFRNHS